jgi:hypothetical protein
MLRQSASLDWAQVTSADAKPTTHSLAKLIRAGLIINLVLILLLIGPGRSHELDLALRRVGLQNFINLFLQVWFVGSTLLTTMFFLWTLVKKPTAIMEKLPRPAPLDWALFLSWWVVLILVCLYAFMLGMGG